MAPKPHNQGKFTVSSRKLILTALQLGSFRDVAAEFAGISPATLTRWLTRPEPRYRAFQQAVLQAEKSRELRAIGLVIKAGQHDVTHARWWLERKYPERWGRKGPRGTRDAFLAQATSGVVVGNGQPSTAVTSARFGFGTLRMRMAALCIPPALSPDVMAERLQIILP